MKRIVICRHGDFADEGPKKGHLSESGEAQMDFIAKHIKKSGPAEKPLYISSPTTLMKESAERLKETLAMGGMIIEEEKWKPGIMESDKEKKEALEELLEKSKASDLIVVVTNGKNIAALPQLFASCPSFKNYPVTSESLEEGGFGLDFTGKKFGFEIRWNAESSGIILEEIFAPI
jgi:phosphohistidine phosphatase SixA